jgi:hypothetical protein
MFFLKNFNHIKMNMVIVMFLQVTMIMVSK